MFNETALFYDLIYERVKDYDAEAAQLVALLQARHPGCRTVLDVACGTGQHAHRLADRGFEVDALDLHPTFVEITRQRHPAGRVFQADMIDFVLPHRYDAVVCLFSSIGYLTTFERVTRALVCFREHLAPGGLVVVEPWLTPDVFAPGRTAEDIGEGGGVRIVRHARTEVEGRVSRIYFDYDIDDASGHRQVSEVHELGLFTTEEMRAAFAAAGLEVEHDPKGLGSRGVFIARRPRT
jgi:SAM-dependent methyltransferase